MTARNVPSATWDELHRQLTEVRATVDALEAQATTPPSAARESMQPHFDVLASILSYFHANGMWEDKRRLDATITAFSKALECLPPSSTRESTATDYPPQHANADGWTDWISPTDIDLYGLQCCECGLKHEVQFRVMRNKAYTDGEHWYADPVPAEDGYHVAFRMRRDGSTPASATGDKVPQPCDDKHECVDRDQCEEAGECLYAMGVLKK